MILKRIYNWLFRYYTRKDRRWSVTETPNPPMYFRIYQNEQLIHDTSVDGPVPDHLAWLVKGLET